MITWFIETITNHSPVLSGGVSAPRLPINCDWGSAGDCDWGSAGSVEW